MQRVVERIINLLAYLLTVGRPVTADEIRNTVAGYDQAGDEAFRRTFERDKDLLRSLGVPLHLDFTDRWEVEQGYVVRPDEYALPDPGLTDEELGALWFAARLARLGDEGASPSGILKLGGTPAGAVEGPLAADLFADATDLGSLFEAVLERCRVTFAYRNERRSVDPLGLVHRMGHWYLVARAGGAVRRFRVDRIEGLRLGSEAGAFDRPPGFKADEGFPEAPWEAGAEEIEAVVEFDPEVAWWARRRVGSRATFEELPGGGLRVRLPVAAPAAFVGMMVAFEDAAVITEPAWLRDTFLEHLGVGA